jgi:hypothetical protein
MAISVAPKIAKRKETSAVKSHLATPASVQALVIAISLKLQIDDSE